MLTPYCALLARAPGCMPLLAGLAAVAEDTEQSLQPLPFSPGFVDRTAIYNSRGTTAGWSWTPYSYKEAFWRLAGELCTPVLHVPVCLCHVRLAATCVAAATRTCNTRRLCAAAVMQTLGRRRDRAPPACTCRLRAASRSGVRTADVHLPMHAWLLLHRSSNEHSLQCILRMQACERARRTLLHACS